MKRAQVLARLSQCKPTLVARFGVTDIALFGYVHVISEAGIERADYPMISRWIDKVRDTAGFRPLRDLGQPTNRAA